MNFGTKILIGALCLILGGEYALYKNFEDSPNTIQEMARYPYNKEYTEVNNLWREYNQLKKSPLETAIDEIEKIRKECTPFEYPRNIESMIKLKNGKKFIYVGNLFAMEGDKISLDFLSSCEITKRKEFIKKVKEFRRQNYMFTYATTECDSFLGIHPNIDTAIENVPQTRLKDLDGIVENYEIIKDN